MTDVVIEGIGQSEVGEHEDIRPRKFLMYIFLLSMLAGCAPKPTELVAITPTEPILVDSFFGAQALLDVNENGQIDPEDTPVENAIFTVTVQGGAGFGDTTDESGRAFVTIPSAVEYPVTLRMEAPKDSTLKLIGPESISFTPGTGGPIQFLFSSE